MNRKILDITIMLVIKLLDWNYFIFKMPGLRFLILEQFYINFQDKNIYIYINVYYVNTRLLSTSSLIYYIIIFNKI